MRGHLGRALDNRVTPGEISELVAHLAFYAGWPVAISVVHETKTVFDQRGVRVPAAATEQLPLDEAAEARRRAAVQASVGVVAPPLADLTNRVLFNDLWRRPGLAPRDRSLVTVAALIATGQTEQMPFHVNRALHAGLTEAQLSEVVTHLGFYAGWPRAMSAVPVVQKPRPSSYVTCPVEMGGAPLYALVRVGKRWVWLRFGRLGWERHDR
ncbi:carboxymuconolactone decarboxylase family protein [Roseomonas mucosa]|nr:MULTISPECIES: carboxymuconolactone decarboxylase family protein [Roseomonas]MCG7354145.1 carboxymuconolactone decarboxylase family protein [Roseomonas mucosa]